MKWSNIGIGKRVEIAGVLANSLGKHIDELAGRGINQEMVDEMFQLIELINDQRIKRDSLQMDVIAKTKELNENVKKLHDHYSVAKKMVKLEIKQSKWGMFGIHDKK